MNLRPEIHAFTKELLRDERRTVGRLDSRFKGIDREPAGEEPEFDPSYAAIQGPYTAVLNDYVRARAELRERPALRDPHRPGAAVELRRVANRFVNVAETCARR